MFQSPKMMILVQSIWRVLMWVIGRKVNERVQWGWNTASAVLQRSIEIILIAIPTRMSLKFQNNFWDLHCLTPTICWCMRSPKVPFVRLLTLNSPKVVAKQSREEKTNLWRNIVVSFFKEIHWEHLSKAAVSEASPAEHTMKWQSSRNEFSNSDISYSTHYQRHNGPEGWVFLPK